MMMMMIRVHTSAYECGRSEQGGPSSGVASDEDAAAAGAAVVEALAASVGQMAVATGEAGEAGLQGGGASGLVEVEGGGGGEATEVAVAAVAVAVAMAAATGVGMGDDAGGVGSAACEASASGAVQEEVTDTAAEGRPERVGRGKRLKGHYRQRLKKRQAAARAASETDGGEADDESSQSRSR